MVEASEVNNGETAKALLASRLDSATVRAVAIRADELRFEASADALDVAEAALDAFRRLPPRLQRPGIGFLAWAAYGSILRTRARYNESEVALAIAARLAPSSRPQVRADLARRFAYLRSDQGHAEETRRLVASVLAFARRVGGRTLGKELVNAGAILILMRDYQAAVPHLEEALALLPANGDTRHISAVANLARCRLELSSSPAQLAEVTQLTRQVAALTETGSYSELKLRWLDGNLQHRLGHLDAGLALFESARLGIDERGDGYDRALLVLDIAELHLDRRDLVSAQELARSSFGILSALRKD
ncbi:MAG: hypothetical protein GY711_06455, partial [bacterium]|nr:hypothetical protein [bacterium]